MSNDEINHMVEDYINSISETKWKKTSKKVKEEWKAKDKENIIKWATELSETGIITLETVKTAIKINQVIEDYVNRSVERDHKKAHKKAKEGIRKWTKEFLIKRAMELSETGTLTLESVTTAIKKSEDEHEEFIKKLKGGSPVLLYIGIWAILTFLIALAINLAFWGALTSQYGKGYWETLFSDGLWAFLVSGIGAIVIIVLVSQGDFP
ncbi:MAG: hypothetical protein ACFE8E_02645 [Candidatus Hodarchaeota archaeon]